MTANAIPDVVQDASSDRGSFPSSQPHHSGDVSSASYPSQLDRMEQMMMRMEEKLATVSSLESRCEQLEAKCSSLENKLESTSQLLKSTSQSVKDHVDRKIDSLRNDLNKTWISIEDRLDGKVDYLQDRAQKYHEYNEMLVRNQSWEFAAEIIRPNNVSIDEEAFFLSQSKQLKDKTTKMRRGEFPHVDGKSISLEIFEQYGQLFYYHLLPYVREFSAALKQFTPAMNLLPDNCERCFTIGNIHLDQDTTIMMKDALIGKPFTIMSFTHNPDAPYDEGMNMDTIMDIVESNKHLRDLGIYYDRIQSTHIDRLCSVVHNYPLLELGLGNSINHSTIGNQMLTSLLTSDELKLETLHMEHCNITTDAIMILADFIASNQGLKDLNLDGNGLNDSDAELIANALRNNTTLRRLHLEANNITRSGFDVFRPVLCDKSSLNAVACSNHTCNLPALNHGNTLYEVKREYNSSDVIAKNRGRKIYFLLSDRHERLKNVQHFSDIDLNILPSMLEAVQRYQGYEESWYEENDNEVLVNYYEEVRGDDSDHSVSSLSIVYEVMRNWDKALTLYE